MMMRRLLLRWSKTSDKNSGCWFDLFVKGQGVLQVFLIIHHQDQLVVVDDNPGTNLILNLSLLRCFFFMESLSISIGVSCFPKIHKLWTPRSKFLFINCKLTPSKIKPHPLKHLPFLPFLFPLSSLASQDVQIPSSNKINLESIVVSIDDFFNRYPFFVAGVVFIWLFVTPFTQEFLRNYKQISAIDAFKKLKDDPNAQLLDIRDHKTLRILGSPNLKMLNKLAVQVEFRDGEDEGFVKKVKQNFQDPSNTTVCILDNFDGESMKVAELLFNNGFKAAYAIRGGVRGNNGWVEIQETLLPPSLHIYPKSKLTNNGPIQQEESKVNSSQLNCVSETESKQTNNGAVNTCSKPTASSKSSSPYSMYPDMKPPTSPTPSKPQY